jgi:curved DNA-binding protein CbpA
MSSDPLGYYSDLGVSHTASPDEIRAVYRALAKIYHPDVNSDEAAAQKFRRIAVAYETVGNPAKRLSYDQAAAPTKATEGDNGAPQRREPVEPVRCSRCDKATAQPRFLIFRQVISFVFLTQTSPKPGIYCSDCAARQGFKSSAISALFGWWGIPWGPVFTIREIIRNAFGGERRQDVDEQLIWQNSVAFMDAGKYDLAGSLARQLLGN